jgi:hypothetical protein
MSAGFVGSQHWRRVKRDSPIAEAGNFGIRTGLRSRGVTTCNRNNHGLEASLFPKSLPAESVLTRLFRGSVGNIVGLGNSFSLRGADRLLELGDELFAEKWRGGVLARRRVFLSFAATCSL